MVKKIRQKIKKLRERGFTLVELLLVTGVMGILSTAVIVNGLGYRNRQALDLAAQQVVANIRDACDRARTQQDGLPWGVYFNNTTTDQYTVFSGATYASSASYTRIPTTLDSPITFTSPASGNATEIRFAQVTCRPHATGTISIYNNSDVRVISIDSNGGVTISDPSAPAQVTGLVATGGDSQVALSWSEPYNGGFSISSYNIYRGLSSESETLLTTATTTSYTNTGLANNTTYYYKVSAVNSAGEGSLSSEVSATPGVSGGLVYAVTSNPSSGIDVLLSIAVDSSYIYAGGYASSSSDTDTQWRIEKRSISDGSLTWATTTNPSANDDKANSIAVDASYVYMGGSDRSPGASNPQWRIEKRSISDGSLTWATTTNPSANADLLNSIAVDSSYVYAGGYDEVLGSGFSQWRIEKRSISDGSLTWATTSNPTATDDGVTSIAIDSSYVYAGGYASGTTLSAWRIEKRSISDGSLTWATTSNPTANDDDVTSIAVDNSYVYIVGYAQPSNYEWRIEKRSISDGSLVWVATSNPSSVIDFANSISVDSSYVYVGGYASSSGVPWWRIEKRSISDGSLVWATTTNPGSGGEINSIDTDTSYIYAGGWDTSPGNVEWRIIKLVK